MSGYDIWENKGFISSPGTSVVARSKAVYQEASKKLLPKKDSFALVFVTEVRGGWMVEG